MRYVLLFLFALIFLISCTCVPDCPEQNPPDIALINSEFRDWNIGEILQLPPVGTWRQYQVTVSCKSDMMYDMGVEFGGVTNLYYAKGIHVFTITISDKVIGKEHIQGSTHVYHM